MSENITEAQAQYITDLEDQVFVTAAVRDQYREIMGNPTNKTEASQYINWLLGTKDGGPAILPTYFTALRALRRADADAAVIADLDAALASVGWERTRETVRLSIARTALVALRDTTASAEGYWRMVSDLARATA